MADKISDNLIEEILNDVKAYTNSDEPEVIYSIEDVDLLLAEISGETEIKVEMSADEAPETIQEESYAPEISEGRTPIVFDVSKVFGNEENDFTSEEETDADVDAEDGSQLEFAHDINETSVPVEEPEESDEDEPEAVAGQISIEKTRMFNEVDIRGAYNPNISHNLGNKVARTTSGDAQPLSSGVMADEKYRKHFMNKPVQKIEDTQEQRAIRSALPQKTIETPGIVVKKSSSSENTDGFSPIPTLVSAEYELEQERTEATDNGIFDDDLFDNQIMFDGFDEDEEILQQSEEQAEAELREHRKEAVKDFVQGDLSFKQEVESPPVKRRYERQKVSIIREYFGPKDKEAVKKVFKMEQKSTVIKLAVVSGICLLMSLFSLVAGVENGNFEIYGNNEAIYSLVQLILLIIAAAINYNSFVNTFKNIKSKIFDMDTVVSVSAIAGLIQCLFSFGFADSVESVARLITGAAVVPMIMKLAGELIRSKNDSGNFNIITKGSYNCCSVDNIPDEDTANEVSRGLMMGNPEIKYSAKIKFPQRFVELSRMAEVTGPICKYTVLAMTLVGLILGVIAVATTKNLFAGVSVFTAVILMTLPCSAGLVSAINLRATNKLLNEDGAIINGYSAVEDAVNSNGVIIDACDAFEKGGCNIEGMKTYHKMRIDEAILYTASVVIASGGVLADVFDGVIIGKRELLFPVESLVYEEKLGCSCWIHNHRVLVGNRDLLVHHNVETPDSDLEEKFKSNGKNVIYLAIEGKIAAMFVVVYKANEETARYLRELEKDGITIFFRTADANITEKFLEREFQLPANVVKIINPVAGDMFTKIKTNRIDRSDAKIIHDGSTKSMLAALHGAFVINSFVNSSRLVQYIASAIGAIIIALLTFLSGLAQIGVLQIILYQVIWAVILSVPALTRKK